MDAKTPESAGKPEGQDGGAGDLAAEALKAAQAAIASLGSLDGPAAAAPPAASGGTGVDNSEIERLMAQAMSDENSIKGASKAQSFTPPSVAPSGNQQKPEGIDLLADVNLNVKIELGRTRMLVEDVLRLGEGSVVELDKLAGDPVDVYVNDRQVARGEVLVLNDNFCVRINEIVSHTGESKR